MRKIKKNPDDNVLRPAGLLYKVNSYVKSAISGLKYQGFATAVSLHNILQCYKAFFNQSIKSSFSFLPYFAVALIDVLFFLSCSSFILGFVLA